MTCRTGVGLRLLALPWCVVLMHGVAADIRPATGAGCEAGDDFFADEVWTKVGAQSCLKCHKPGGDAEESEFILRDPSRENSREKEGAMAHNRDAFARMARLKEEDQSRLLLKARGELEHGGEEILEPGTTGYALLEQFVARVGAPLSPPASANPNGEERKTGTFFEGISMLDDRALLRRAALSLAARLPSASEIAAVEKSGLKALPALLDAMMREDAFHDRLREGFNDIFLTVGFDGGAETALSYEHFSTTRLWYQKHDLSHIADEDARRRAGYKLAADYRAALLGEPMKLIEHIVRNDRPFTEIVTADYIMVTPYSARGYGVFEELRPKFRDPEDPFEYIPVKLKALVGRNESRNQESATGFYPHAGLLSTFQYLRRYPTTETNRNRLRTRMYYQHFLGIDVMELAARVTDAAAATAKYEIPTMQAADCVVCHKTIDPVAGLFQDFYDIEGVYGRRKEGWYPDMFSAGFEGEALPEDQRWRALAWLGERTAKDPRFAVAMVEHVHYILTGRKALTPPKEIDDPRFGAKRRAYEAQRGEIEAIAARFAKDGFNLKSVFKGWVVSDFHRADGLTTSLESPDRIAELEDIGVARLLAPEQVERKVAAIFGEPWGRLTDQLAILYGGIDSREVTERATDPSGAMGAIQRILANDLACKHTAMDFARDPEDRLLFPVVEPGVVPGASAEADETIRRAIAHLHERVLGRHDAADSPDVERTYRLFAGIVSDANASEGFERQEIYHCRNGQEVPDPNYTIRAWRGVLTYLLRRHEFLYE